MVAAGARVVIAIADRPWGKREGRIADPSGHLWILSEPIEDVSEEESRRRLAER
jgi:PhnB protein